MPANCNYIVEIRHSNPAMINRIEAALQAGRLCHEFVPEPTLDGIIEWAENELRPSRLCEAEHISEPLMYQGSYSEDQAEFLRSWWRSTHWGACGHDILPGALVDKVSPTILKAKFCSRALPAKRMLSLLLGLGYSIEGRIFDSYNVYAWLYDNGSWENDETADTMRNSTAREYLENCRLRGVEPVLDSEGKPDRGAVREFDETRTYVDDARPVELPLSWIANGEATRRLWLISTTVSQKKNRSTSSKQNSTRG